MTASTSEQAITKNLSSLTRAMIESGQMDNENRTLTKLTIMVSNLLSAAETLSLTDPRVEWDSFWKMVISNQKPLAVTFHWDHYWTENLAGNVDYHSKETKAAAAMVASINEKLPLSEDIAKAVYATVIPSMLLMYRSGMKHDTVCLWQAEYEKYKKGMAKAVLSEILLILAKSIDGSGKGTVH